MRNVSGLDDRDIFLKCGEESMVRISEPASTNILMFFLCGILKVDIHF